MNRELLKIALRQQALYLPAAVYPSPTPPTANTLALVFELRQLGFGVSEPLLHALNGLDEEGRQTVLDVLNDVMGTKLNWASLTRGWLVPTGETVWDHFVTLIANVMLKEQGVDVKEAQGGTALPCGHFIPDGTFNLERYNGCPFCGTPFHTADFVYRGQGSKLKQLQLWGDDDMRQLFSNLLLSPVPLDATQKDSLKTLLRYYELPDDADIRVKETVMLVADELVANGNDQKAATLMKTPTDVLRFLWYRHTGRVQIIEPRTLLHTARKNQLADSGLPAANTAATTDQTVDSERQRLKLKYTRPWCRRIARWLNDLPMDIDQQLETMHPKREMWVRVIRALRLYEYAKRPGYERLAVLLDRFYRQDYDVWKGRVDHCRLTNDADGTLQLLKQRPGIFARSLFATMLTFGRERVIAAFREVMPQVAPQLLLSLAGQAENYFVRDAQRVARPLSGVMKQIPPQPLLIHYTDDELKAMQNDVRQLFLDAMRLHFTRLLPPSSLLLPRQKIYISPELDDIPVSVGDRSATIQDTACALQGTRFHVEGDSVRLFLQWGKDLPAQHLDMDLSCHILFDDDHSEVCAYYNLSPEGALHSGDIQHIPDLVGTAEYVELQLPVLQRRGARLVVFTCNAYTGGALEPNLMVGWMSSKYPMKVSNKKGVAYDPSTVQHAVRIAESNLSKGLIFGVLDVEAREITWLEMPFDGQTVASISMTTVNAYLRRLRAKPTIGQILRIKADVQGLSIVDTPEEADEAYTLLWAQDTAAVNRLLFSA